MKKDENAVKEYLENLSFATKSQEYKSASLEYRVFQYLVGTTRSSRLGPFPSDETVKVICKNIKEKIQKNQPIQIVSAWGAKKTFPKSEQQVDIAEYFALLQYATIAQEVQKIYSPGVQYNIFIGDAYYKYLYGDDSDVSYYRSRMNSLAAIFDAKLFKIFSLEKIHQQNDGLLTQCNLNYRLIDEYWKDSASISEKDWTELKSYAILCQNGWIGTIPSIMREHYMKRLDALFPEFTYEKKISSIVKFFAYGMMISQNDLFGRKDQNLCTADFCLLRIPPPGIPKSLHGNRLKKRIIPAKLTKKTAPPWTIKGGLIYDNTLSSYKPVLISYGDKIKTLEKIVMKVNLFEQFDLSVEVFE